MYKNELADLLRQRRKVLGIDQRMLAKLAGVHYNTIVQMELGHGNSTLEVLQKVTDVLGLEVVIRVKKNPEE